MTLNEAIQAIHHALEDAQIPHAFGGALALAYCTEEPRATADVDVNVFVPATSAETVFAALPPGVFVGEAERQEAERDGQVRLRWDDVPLDLFFGGHEFQLEAGSRIRRVPFGDGEIPVLDCNDLAVFKSLFGRPQDWVDIQKMHEAGTIDPQEVTAWLVRLTGADSVEAQQLRAALFPGVVDPTERMRRVFGGPDESVET